MPAAIPADVWAQATRFGAPWARVGISRRSLSRHQEKSS